MIITSFTCNSINNNTITAVLVSASVYSNVVIQVAEYGSSGQLTGWTTVSNLTSTNQTINYTITNPNTTTLNVRLKSTSEVCDDGSSGSGSGSGSGGGGSGGDGGGSDGGGSESGGGSDGSEVGSGTGDGSDETGSGSDEQSGSDQSGSETGCDVCLSDVTWLYLCEGSGSEETGGSGSESGSGSGGPGPTLRGVPAPPSIPDQHMVWPPIMNLGDNNFVFANADQQVEFGAVFNPIRDIFDENIAEDKWTLFYYEITINNSSGSESGSQTGNNDRTISAIWVKRSSAKIWAGANYFSNYYIYGNPIGVNMGFGESNKEDFVRDIGDMTPLRVAGDILLDQLPNIEQVGGYLIETIKYVADNQLLGDGSHKIWGSNLSTVTIDNILRVPASTSTDDLDDITISLLTTS